MKKRQEHNMKNFAIRYSLLSFVLFLSFNNSSFVFAEEKPYPKIGPGLTYIHERHGEEPLSIHILQIDRANPDFDYTITLAKHHVFGLQKTTQQVQEIPSEAGEPIAAINGDFFAIAQGPYQGDLVGLHIQNGELISSPGNVAFWIDSAGKFDMGEVKSGMNVTWDNGKTTSIGLNQARSDDQIVLYIPTLGESTRTQGGMELVLESADSKNFLPLQANRTYTVKIKAILKEGNTPLSPNVMILSIGPKAAEKIPAVKTGDTLFISTDMAPSMRNVKTALGGYPLLVVDGKMCKFSESDGYLTSRHPRTVISWNDKFMYWVVVDGRQADLSRGMSFHELAQLMIRLGCKEAINLDGGGSSTFWLGGKILNSPSDGHERSVANALVLLRKTKTTTSATATQKTVK
jgi:exopolysaccharide biosynthesis protein